MQGLAPDQASLTAAGGLLKPTKWPVLGHAGDRQLVWGECQGSGSTPYRVCATLDDLSHTCTCPSRKQPCKHALALLWFAADKPAMVTDGAPPGWVEDWLGKRKKRGPAVGRPGDAGPKDISAALAVAPVDADEAAKRAAASAKAAEKRRQDREDAILGGLEELERWVGDVVGDGLATFPARATERCRRIASRLVDAKAAALGTRIDELPGALFALPDEQRSSWLLGELGRLVLLVKAYRRQASLPPALREDVRRLVGWTVTRDALLEDPATLRVHDAWTVLAVREVPQVDRLLRRETHLRRHGHPANGPDFALLLDYFPIGAPGDATFAAGEVLGATLAFYPSAVPLRALVAVRDVVEVAAPAESALTGGDAARRAGDGLDAATLDAQHRLARHPWLDPVPMLVQGATLGKVGSRFVLTTPDGAFRPVLNATDAALYALGGVGPASVAALWEPGGLRLLAAATSLGFWGAP